MKKKERNSNFELMRIVSMLFIVLWHICLYGGINNNPRILNNNIIIIFEFISFILVVHVNSFPLLTGYFQSKSRFNIKKIIPLINTTFFYKIVFIFLFLVLGIVNMTKVDILDGVFIRDYWFVQLYIMLYLLSPFLNKIINKFSKKEYEKILLLLFLILSIIPFITGNRTNISNNGYTLIHFIYLYLIGAYLRKYPIRESYIFKMCSKNLYRLILVIIFIFCFMINYMNYKTLGLLSSSNSIFNLLNDNYHNIYNVYSNPFVIIQSISYFLLFETLDFKSKLINRISLLVLGVYFIHENGLVRGYIYKWLKIDNGIVTSYKFVLYVFGMVFIIFIGCAIIEFVRQVIFKFIYNRKLSQKVRNKFYSFIDSFKIEEKEKKNG